MVVVEDTEEGVDTERVDGGGGGFMGRARCGFDTVGHGATNHMADRAALHSASHTD